VVVREFLVGEGRERDFEKVFGPGGIWVELLGNSKQYLGTQLRVELNTGRLFEVKVLDYWRSHWGFERFRGQFQPKYERFCELIVSEGLVQRERLLGSFYEDDPDVEDGTDFVSS
jgi:hypothetical protein